MNRSRWLFHPILILIFSILALGTSLFLYIYWYIEASTGLKSIVERFNLDAGQVLESQTWVVILVLSILVGIIFMGIFIIFVYNLKTLQLYRLQHNFINSFTHELKTPVTALKAGCLVSKSFFPADRYSPSAPKLPAAIALCSDVSVLLTPSQESDIRAAAIVVRSRCDGDVDGRTTGSVRSVVM